MSKYKPSKKWARLFFPAVDELIEHYKWCLKNNIKTRQTAYIAVTRRDCPLCATTRILGKKDCSSFKCQYCPWVLFEKRNCFDSENEEGNDRFIYHPIKTRLTRLRRWKRKMRGILKK